MRLNGNFGAAQFTAELRSILPSLRKDGYTLLKPAKETTKSAGIALRNSAGSTSCFVERVPHKALELEIVAQANLDPIVILLLAELGAVSSQEKGGAETDIEICHRAVRELWNDVQARIR